MRNRLDQAVERVVVEVEEAAEERGIPQKVASNIAHDLAIQDDRLTRLADIEDDVTQLELSLAPDDGVDRVESKVINAGISLDDAVMARVEQLVEECVEEAHRVAIEDGVEA